MCQSRIRFKRTLRECKQDEEIIRANEHAKSFMDKDMTLIWKGNKENYNSRVPLAPMIDKCIGEKDICDMWQAHYKKNCLTALQLLSQRNLLNKNLNLL